jgi:hypothetical protein
MTHGELVPEERDLADALIKIADKYGKFNEDQTGIWADYHSAEDNPYAAMGVKCGNCVLYRGGTECAIIAFKVEPEGYCRFAVLPDGAVDPTKAPRSTAPKQNIPVDEMFKHREAPIEEYIKTVAENMDPHEKKRVPLSSLVPTQGAISLRKLSEVEDDHAPIKVYVSNSGTKILNGHHRAVSHILQGEVDIEAKVYYPSDY